MAPRLGSGSVAHGSSARLRVIVRQCRGRGGAADEGDRVVSILDRGREAAIVVTSLRKAIEDVVSIGGDDRGGTGLVWSRGCFCEHVAVGIVGVPRRACRVT